MNFSLSLHRIPRGLSFDLQCAIGSAFGATLDDCGFQLGWPLVPRSSWRAWACGVQFASVRLRPHEWSRAVVDSRGACGVRLQTPQIGISGLACDVLAQCWKNLTVNGDEPVRVLRFQSSMLPIDVKDVNAIHLSDIFWYQLSRSLGA